MPFPADLVPPTRLSTATFVLRPIAVADVELDYAAVMESRKFLRRWEQSGWPADDFTVDENREDLEKLEHWHRDNAAFSYTVMNPAETECLGCVYIFPPDARSLVRTTITAVAADAWEDQDAAVYLWARASQLEHGTDRLLLEALRTWLKQEWTFRHWVFVTNEQFTQQVDMFEAAGLTLRFELDDPGKPGRFLAYA